MTDVTAFGRISDINQKQLVWGGNNAFQIWPHGTHNRFSSGANHFWGW